ncbi:MAG TPA: FAD-dependent oxidoreductase, partial [Micropepsaceae bacterium]|nr:FAD-dependent oxidoreductase [Micropepsaceae bacterium]
PAELECASISNIPGAAADESVSSHDQRRAVGDWTRRAFLAAGAALGAGPAWGAPRRAPPPQELPRSGSADVIIVGAGAAGIAAARRLAAAGKRVALLEAANEIGGRCITDTATFSVPYDRGAHRIYLADNSPIAKLAPQTGLDLYLAPPGQRMRIGRRYAREGEMEDFLASLVRANAAIRDAARKNDIACAQVLPKDLGEWRPTIDFILGVYNCDKDLAELSTVDVSRAAERDNGAFCRQGLGTLLAKLAPAGAVQVSTPVTRIDWGRANVEMETARGQFRAPAAIVTVSTNVLLSGKIKFEVPKRHLDAANKLKLGSHDHIAVELRGNPLGLRADEIVFEKSESKDTAAILGNVSGSTLCIIDVGGSFGRDLTAKGEDAMMEFANGWLAGLYGTDIKASVKRHHVTRWNYEPWVLGAASAAVPGGQSARKVMMEPVSNRIFFAGEAVHETLWGTVGGAWESGERAADAVLRLIGGRRS